jgi:hypothetical protein
MFLVILSGMIGLALVVAPYPPLFFIMALLSGSLAVISLISLGMSLMMPTQVRCPRCGQNSEVRARMSGGLELH